MMAMASIIATTPITKMATMINMTTDIINMEARVIMMKRKQKNSILDQVNLI